MERLEINSEMRMNCLKFLSIHKRSAFQVKATNRHLQSIKLGINKTPDPAIMCSKACSCSPRCRRLHPRPLLPLTQLGRRRRPDVPYPSLVIADCLGYCVEAGAGVRLRQLPLVQGLDQCAEEKRVAPHRAGSSTVAQVIDQALET